MFVILNGNGAFPFTVRIPKEARASRIGCIAEKADSACYAGATSCPVATMSANVAVPPLRTEADWAKTDIRTVRLGCELDCCGVGHSRRAGLHYRAPTALVEQVTDLCESASRA